MRILFFLALVLLFQFSITATARSSDDLTSQLDNLVQDTSVRPFNGVILITQGSETLYARAQGYGDFVAKTPIKMSDKFRIQSNSKQITAVLVLREVERGTIQLDAPISSYLKTLDQDWSDLVTVHNLLNMTSGIKSIDADLAFEPGTNFHYSNPGYGLLGAILENVTGTPYVQLAEQLFAELGMHNTSPYIMGESNDVISGHMGTRYYIEPLDFAAIGFTQESWKRFIPTGGIISNAADLLIWDTKLHTGKLLTDDSYNKMSQYSIMASHAAFGSDEIGYGYGLRIDDVSATKHIGHAGRGIGFASIKFYIPEHDISVIVLENVYIMDDTRNAKIVYHFEREIRDLILRSLS